MIPLLNTRIAELPASAEIVLLLPTATAGEPVTPVSGVRGTVQEFAEAIGPLVRAEAVQIQIGKMELRPGEILIIQSAQPLSMEQVEHLRASLHRLLPGQPVFVLLPGFHLYGIRPAEDGLRALAEQLRPFLTEPTGASST